MASAGQHLRICYVIESAGGGSGRHVLHLAEHFTARGHKVALLYSRDRAEPAFLERLAQTRIAISAPIPMGRSIGIGDLLAAHRLRLALRSYGPFDIVHGHSSKGGALARVAAPADAVRVYTPHAFRTMDPTVSGLARVTYGSIERLLAQRSTEAIVVVSRAELDHAKSLGLPGHKLRLIVNGVEPRPPCSRAALRRPLGVNPEDMVLGFVGRLSPQKAPERFVEVLAKLAAHHRSARGVMFGDGEAKSHILRKIEEAGLNGIVRLHNGWDAAHYMQAFDALVMTSRYEAMPYVLLEALVAGLPIVTTAVGGVAETVVDGVNGFVVADDDPVAGLARSAGRLITEPALRSKMAAHSRMLGAKHQVAVMIAETEKLYLDLLVPTASADQPLQAARAA